MMKKLIERKNKNEIHFVAYEINNLYKVTFFYQRLNSLYHYI